jgi:hypothetical protein
MKALLACALALLVTAVTPSSQAQTAYERELEQLMDQRDKALAAAEAPINERFRAAAEQLLRRATQGGDLAAANRIKEVLDATSRSSSTGIKDLRKDIVGTTWKCMPGKPVRGGLGPTFSFTEKGVQPGGYKYEVDRSNTVIITFNAGGTQVMNLAKGGTRLEFSLGNVDHVYELVRK